MPLAFSGCSLGLRLSLAKRLEELQGGAIRAASQGPGRGAEFLIQLPVEPEPAALTDLPAEPAPRRSGLQSAGLPHGCRRSSRGTVALSANEGPAVFLLVLGLGRFILNQRRYLLLGAAAVNQVPPLPFPLAPKVTGHDRRSD